MGKQASSRGRQPPAPGFQPMQSRQLQTRPQTRPQALGNALATPDPFQVTAADITDPYARQRRAAEGVPSASASDIQLRPPQVEQNPNLGPTRIDGGGFAMPSQSRPFQSEPNPAYGPTRLDGGGYAMPSQSSPNPAYGPTKIDGGGYAMPGMEQAPGAGRGIVWMEGQSNAQGRGTPLRAIPGRQGLAGLPNAAPIPSTPTPGVPGRGPQGPAPSTPFQNGQVGWEFDTGGRGWIPQMNQAAVNYWGDMRSYAPQGFNPDANDWIGSVQKWAPVSYEEWAKGHGRGYVNPYSR
jgi:hypothetical protein